MSVIGTRRPRLEDLPILRGVREYVADLGVEGVAHVTYVRSTIAHARITGIDVSEALAVPGVVTVLTHDDLDAGLVPSVPMAHGRPAPRPDMVRPWLADGVVRHVGEPIAAVVSETAAQGVDAAELVLVDYEPIPAVVDPEAALAGEVLLFPATGSNVVLAVGEVTDDCFADCEVVVRLRLRHQRLNAAPMEARGSVARWDADGRLTFWTGTQNPHDVRDELARFLEVDPAVVRVITPATGGAFGAKGEWYHDQLLPAWIARRLGRPVAWIETRSDAMVAMVHGRGQLQDVVIGGTRDGRLLAYRLDVLQDAGAYPGLGSMVGLFTTLPFATGAYAFERIETRFRSVVTTTTPMGAYRGAGRPEATGAVERAVDAFAAEIGVDPAEVRRRNCIPTAAFPYTLPSGETIDVGDFEGALARVLDGIDYAARRTEQARRLAAGTEPWLGIGLSLYLERASTTNPEFGSIEVLADGRAVVGTGTASHGQSHMTTWAMIASDVLGIDVGAIDVVHGDTGRIPFGIGTYGSRSTQTGGVAVHLAAVALVEQSRALAAELLEAAPEDVVFDRAAGRFAVVGSEAHGVGWVDLGREFAGTGRLRAESQETFPPTYPFGAHAAVVEVDPETGGVTLVDLLAVDDAGRVVNPLAAEGQIVGGVVQGVAQALFEEMAYDPDGNPLTVTLMDYKVPSAAEVPPIRTVFLEVPTATNALGVKGIAEAGTIGATAAVHNAGVDALAHLGVRHLDMPLTPERVWRAVAGAGAGSSGTGPGGAPSLSP